jgi:hypothetical protein
VKYPYRPFREANLDHTLQFWETNFIKHRAWVGSLYEEARELSTYCHEHPLDTSLFCLAIEVKTLQLLAIEFDLDIISELPRLLSPTSQLCEELISVTRQGGAKIDREVAATGQVLLCKCFSSGVPRHIDFDFEHRFLRR